MPHSNRNHLELLHPVPCIIHKHTSLSHWSHWLTPAANQKILERGVCCVKFCVLLFYLCVHYAHPLACSDKKCFISQWAELRVTNNRKSRGSKDAARTILLRLLCNTIFFYILMQDIHSLSDGYKDYLVLNNNLVVSMTLLQDKDKLLRVLILCWVYSMSFMVWLVGGPKKILQVLGGKNLDFLMRNLFILLTFPRTFAAVFFLYTVFNMKQIMMIFLIVAHKKIKEGVVIVIKLESYWNAFLFLLLMKWKTSCRLITWRLKFLISLFLFIIMIFHLKLMITWCLRLDITSDHWKSILIEKGAFNYKVCLIPALSLFSEAYFILTLKPHILFSTRCLIW